MSMQLIPYLNFDGHTEEAMNFYRGIFGGTLELLRMSEMPMQVPEEHKHRVMHASLKSEVISLMASDGRLDRHTVMGDNVHLSLHFTDTEVQTHTFDALAIGGEVTQPLMDAFFGRFGTLIDRFGTHWMFMCTPPAGSALNASRPGE